MAVINLKEEKRINVNGEFDEVVTQLNNEPIFRQNGHELVFDANNIDYLEGLNNKVTTTLDELSFSIRLRTPSEFSTLIQQVFFLNYADSTNFFQVYVNKESGALIVFAFDSSGSTVTIGTSYILLTNTDYLLEWDGVSGEFKVNDSVVYTLANPSSYSFITDTTKPFRISQGNSSRQMSMTLYDFQLNNETFNPTDIDSNAQIEGSSGTVATVNTSHASGLSYILGTVFQKSSFALKFDSANSEYLEGDINDVVTNLSEINFSVNFKTPSDLTGNLQILTISVTTPSLFSLYCANGALIALIIDSSNNVVSIGSTYLLNVDTDYIIDFDGTNLFVNGNIEYTVTDSELKLINIDNSDVFRFNQYRNTRYSSYTLYSLTVLGTNYPLTEGLGNTTNGATINTSHADGIKRINFGMWLKGNDTDGWTPYTIV